MEEYRISVRAAHPLAFLLAAAASYILGYWYISIILFSRTDWIDTGSPAVQPFLFTVFYIAFVNVFTIAVKGKSTWKRESTIWGILLFLQALAFAVQGMHAFPIDLFQFLLWHVTAVYYAAITAGLLTAGRTGAMIWLDLLHMFITVPFSNILLRWKSIFSGISLLAHGRFKGTGKKRIAIIIWSILAAIFLGMYASSQLAAADPRFAGFSGAFGRAFGSFFRTLARQNWLERFLCSIPFGWYLFAVTAGALCTPDPEMNEVLFRCRMVPFRRLPKITAFIVMGALSVMYAVFLVLQGADFFEMIKWKSMLTPLLPLPFQSMQQTHILTAADASFTAVNGFWELCRVWCLNMFVLAALAFFLNTENGREKNPMRRRGWVRRLSVIFMMMTIAFAVVALFKVLLYICLYGLTIRRILALWYVLVLLAVGVMALVRLFVRFHGVRAALLTAALSFTVLMQFNLEGAALDVQAQAVDEGASHAIEDDDGPYDDNSGLSEENSGSVQNSVSEQNSNSSMKSSFSSDGSGNQAAGANTDDYDDQDGDVTYPGEEADHYTEAGFEQDAQQIDIGYGVVANVVAGDLNGGQSKGNAGNSLGGKWSYKMDYNAKGEDYITFSGDSSREIRLIYYKDSQNGKCAIYALEEAPSGNDFFSTAAISNMYAYEYDTGRVVAGGQKDWGDAGNKAFREITEN